MSISTEKRSHYGTLSPEFAILGLLCGAPMHGYDLHRRLVTDLGQVWHLSQSQAYAILKRLENHGEVFSESVPQEKLPSRQILHVSPAGRQRFTDWMRSPNGGSIRAIRMEFLTRLYFTRLYEPENTGRLFEAQRAATETNVRRLAASLQALPADQVFNRMSLEMRIRQLNLALDWLDECWESFGGESHTHPAPTTGASK